MKYVASALLLSIGLIVASGCSLLQASPQEVERYRAEFFELFDRATLEAENGQKVLAEIRHKVDHEGMKKTRALNTLSDGADIAKAIKEDVIKAKVPDDLEPIRELWIQSLDKRIEAYNELFLYYDFMDEERRIKGDALLKESLDMFEDVKRQMELYRN